MIKRDGFHVNTSANLEAVKEASKAILSILNARADQETIRVALTCLKESCQSGSSVITNCVATGVGDSGFCQGIVKEEQEADEKGS